MLQILFIIQFSIALLLLFSVLIQRTGKQSLAGFESSSSSSLDNNFIIKITWTLVVLFFLNSIILGNVAVKHSKQKDIIKIESKTLKPQKDKLIEPKQEKDNKPTQMTPKNEIKEEEDVKDKEDKEKKEDIKGKEETEKK